MQIQHSLQEKLRQQEMDIPEVLLTTVTICDSVKLHSHNILHTREAHTVYLIGFIEERVSIHTVQLNLITIIEGVADIVRVAESNIRPMSIYLIKFLCEHLEHCFKIHSTILLRSKVINVI